MRTAISITCCLLATSTFPLPAHAGALNEITATVETGPNWDDEAGGNADADDPAIWVNRADPAHSLVLGTLKNGGLTVVDLAGRQLEHVPTPPAPEPGQEPGRFNNVDLLGDLAVVTDRGLDQLRLYRVGARGVTDVTTPRPPLVFSRDTTEVQEQRTAYGVAITSDQVAVSRRSETRVGFFRLVPAAHGKLTYRPIRHVDLPDTFRLRNGSTWSPCEEPGDRPQVEGMVFDPTTGDLYAAQEDIGIWRIPRSGRPELVEKVREFGQPAAYDEETEECVPTGPAAPDAGKHLSADAEGLTIAGRTLYASSQGDSTFAKFAITRHGLRYQAGFRVVDGPAADGVQHSDGAAVTTTPLGPKFRHGLAVVHDGENTPGDGEREGTNFKLIPFERLP